MSRISDEFNNMGALLPACYDEPIVQSAGKPSAPPPAYEEPSALPMPAYSPGVEVSNKIHGRVKVLELDNLQEREIGFFERIYIAISRIFTTKYKAIYTDFRDLKQIAASDEPIKTADLSGIKTKLNHVLSSQKDDFVLDFSKKLLLNSQLVEAKGLLEMHSDVLNPKVLFLRAAIFEQKRENAEVNGGEYVDDTPLFQFLDKPLKLEDITSLSVDELKMLNTLKHGEIGFFSINNRLKSERVETLQRMNYKELEYLWLNTCITRDNKFDNLLVLYFRIKGETAISYLSSAISSGNSESAKAIIEAAKSESADTLSTALNPKRLAHKIWNFNWHPYFKDTPLHIAAEKGNNEVAKVIIEAARIDETLLFNVLTAEKISDKNSPTGEHSLMLAVKNGNVELVKVIIEAAKVNKELLDNILTTKDKQGRNSLFWAMENGNVEVLKAIVDAAENDATLLADMLAAKDEHGRDSLFVAKFKCTPQSNSPEDKRESYREIVTFLEEKAKTLEL